MRRALSLAATAVAAGLVVGAVLGHTTAAAVSHRDRLGFDVSWPQCSGSSVGHMPARRPSYVILGLTYGSGHTVNPCLAAQRRWAKARGVRTGAYLVASYPDRLQRRAARLSIHRNCRRPVRCVLAKDGAIQARDALSTMRHVGLRAPRVWLDVESLHSRPWSGHKQANAAVIRGIVRGLSQAHQPVGVYTTWYMWHATVGSYRLDVPNWLPIGYGTSTHALRMCTTTATGGPAWLVQYVHGLDRDLTCPVLDPVKGRHGRLWQFRKTTLKLYSRGPAVRAIQQRVGGPVTGTYGPLTVRAVRKWQRSSGLKPTGRVTPVEWRELGAFRTFGGHRFLLSKVAQ